MFSKYRMRSYNFRLYVIVIVTSVFGLIIINSADSSYTLRQAFGLAAAVIWMTFLSFVDYKKILKFHRLLYVFAIILLIAVLLFGTKAGGATRWLAFGGFRLQPSEISKVLLVLFMSQFLVEHKNRLDSWKFLGITALILVIPLGLIVNEPDLSQTILTSVILFSVLFSAGLPYKKLGKVLAVVVPIAIVVLIYIQNPDQKLLKTYQWYRVMAFLKPEQFDDSVYQQENAVTAIGTGGLTGKGLNSDDPSSLLHNNYIPEAHTDFVFAALGEQLGFIGCVAALVLLAAIVFECVFISVKSRDQSAKLIAIGIATHIAIQTFFNVGVVTRLLPNTGLALPFFSYGLSSLITLYTAMGIMLNLSLHIEPYKDKDIYAKDFVDVKEFRKKNEKIHMEL